MKTKDENLYYDRDVIIVVVYPLTAYIYLR